LKSAVPADDKLPTSKVNLTMTEEMLYDTFALLRFQGSRKVVGQTGQTGRKQALNG